MCKVFISHALEDKDFSIKLEKFLKNDGMKEIWVDYDYNRIEPGKIFLEEIGKGIKNSDIIILVWSKFAKKSEYVKAEWTSAFVNKKRIIPLVFDNTKLPTILQGYQHINFNNFEEGYLKLAISLNLKEKYKKALATQCN
jgi:hypothetical protein